MISKMRDMAPVVMWIVIIAFVGTIFFAWGMDFTGRMGMGGNRNSVGNIDGKEIPLQYFERRVSMAREQMQRSGESDASGYQSRQIPHQVWEQEVNQIIMNKTFSKMQLGATTDEVFEHFKNNPPGGIDTASYFQKNGKFDTTKYVAWLNSPSAYDNPGMLEIESYAEKVLVPMQKLDNLLNAGTMPSKAEIALEYRTFHEKAVFEYAITRNTAFTIEPSAITPDMINQFYKANQDSFFSNEQAEVYFLSIPKKITDKDIKMDSDELAEMKSRIEKKETTFEEEAKTGSDEETAASGGGDLGWVKQGTLDPAIDKAAFSLLPGQVSDPIRAGNGFHLILVVEKRTTDKKPEVHLRDILRKITPSIETLDSLKGYADSLRDMAAKDGITEVVKKVSNGTYDSTGLFLKGAIVNKVGYVEGLSRFAFENEIGDVAEQVMENKEAYFVFQIKRRLKKGIMELDDVKQRIVDRLIDSLQHQHADSYIQSAIAKLGPSDSLASLSTHESMIVSGVSDTITRNSMVPNIGSANKAIAMAFALPQGQRSGVLNIPSGYCVVRTLWRHPVDSIPWGSPEIQMVTQRLTMQAQQRISMQWYRYEKTTAKIESYVDKFYQE